MEKKITDWGQLRFSVIGGLLARPPKKGKLGAAIRLLADQRYRHPYKDEWVRFGFSTIERWYYRALSAADPVQALSRNIRSDSGVNRAMSAGMLKELGEQYRKYPHWSYKLHADNLAALVDEIELGDAPSYSTVRRRMKERGWIKKRRPRTAGQRKAAIRLEQKEVRSYEHDHVHALWHLDFHMCSRRVVDAKGQYHSPRALCVIDDCSRLCCHIQWYIHETAQNLIHGLTQGFHKRGLPRSLMTDNGAAMLARETKNGLARLGVEHYTTLPYSPYQNGKQEAFWAQLEGRMIAMLAGIDRLDLSLLNRTTQAWVEMEYNRTRHRELNISPLDKLLQGPDVSRSCPGSEQLRLAFTDLQTRKLRRSDATLQISGVRFEVPGRFRHFDRLSVRVQSWDLSRAYVVDQKSHALLATIFPMDKVKNSHGKRRSFDQETHINSHQDKPEGFPPLLRKLMADYAATGLPAAYIPKEDSDER